MRASNLMWLTLTVAVGAALFMLKYKVQDLERELSAKQVQVAKGQSAIRVLQAEWTYLNDPNRLRRLSEEYLSLHPATSQNVGSLDTLPMRGSAAPQINAAAHTTIQSELRAPAMPVPTPNRPSPMSVAFARLQQLLVPSAAGAATISASSSHDHDAPPSSEAPQ